MNPNIDISISAKKPVANYGGKNEISINPLDHFQLEKILMVNGLINVHYQDDLVLHAFNLKNVNLDINKINIDSVTYLDHSLSFIDNIQIRSEEIKYSGLQEIDTAYLASLSIDTDDYVKLTDMYIGTNLNGIKITSAIPTLSIYGKNWLRNVMSKNYLFDSIISIRPDVQLTLPDSSTAPKTIRNLFQDTIRVFQVRIENGKMVFNQKTKSILIPDFDLNVSRLNYFNENPNSLYSDNIDLRVRNLNDLLANDLNQMDIEEIHISTSMGLMDIEGFSYEPKLTKQDYGWKVGKQTDWMAVRNNKIRITGFDFNKLISNQALYIGEIYIDSVDIRLYRDKNVPFPKDQIRYMPQKMIRDIPIPFTIENITLNQANIYYEELAPQASVPGLFEITNLTAGFHNITNDSVSLAKDTLMLVGASAQLMGSGNLQVSYEYNLIDPENGHTYIGHLGKMDLTELNKMLVPNASVQIKSGTLSKMDFRVTGNNDYTIGSMTMHYNDLHVKAISKKSETPKGMGPAFVTFFANTFVINRNNPKLLIARQGDIYSERDSTKSVFNYMSKTALSGVVSSIGARNNRKEIKKLNKEAKEIKDKKRLRRQKKEEKKREREEKKEERNIRQVEGIKEE